MKLRWTDCGGKLISLNGSLPYKIRYTLGRYNTQAGLGTLGRYNTQLEAIKACQDYEDKLNT